MWLKSGDLVAAQNHLFFYKFKKIFTSWKNKFQLLPKNSRFARVVNIGGRNQAAPRTCLPSESGSISLTKERTRAATANFHDLAKPMRSGGREQKKVNEKAKKELERHQRILCRTIWTIRLVHARPSSIGENSPERRERGKVRSIRDRQVKVAATVFV